MAIATPGFRQLCKRAFRPAGKVADFACSSERGDYVSSPTVRRRRIARELRQLREQSAMTLEQAARQLDMSKSNLSRIENGQIGIKPRDVRAALALYGVTGPSAEALIDTARSAQERGWWQSYSDVLPDWFEFYVGLEAEAASIRTYESETVPGLLQNESYARAVFRITAGDDEIERKVSARMQRQAVLQRQPPVELSAVLNEAVLMRPVGGPAVMGEQLDHLARLAELPTVTIQILPFAVGGHPAMTTPYVIVGFADVADEPVVYLDNLTVGHAFEEPDYVARYGELHDRLRDMALSPTLSMARICDAARDIR
jgi:transcriptional regulator with XRE-family HTH domain